MLAFFLNLLYWSFAPIRFVKRNLSWLVTDRPGTYKPRNILGDGVFSTLKSSVFLLTENDLPNGDPIGVGFCVGGSDKAVTACHNLPSKCKVGSCVKGFFGPPHAGETLEMRVKHMDTKLDFAVLEIMHATFSYQSLPVYTSVPEEGYECVLAAYQVSLVTQLQPDITTRHSLGIIRASLTRVHTRHIVYECPSFAGDSGGALVFSDGAVVGMHIETVNQAAERLGHSTSIGARLDDVERSVDSMIRNLSSGCIGVKAATFAKLVL